MGLLSKKKTPNPEELYNACKTNNRAEVTRLIDAKYELMETLLKAGADADKQNKLGQTALHCAAGYGAKESVALLLAHGAKMVADVEGQTPLDLATNYRQAEVVEMLSPT